MRSSCDQSPEPTATPMATTWATRTRTEAALTGEVSSNELVTTH